MGELARVAGRQLQVSVPEILPLIIDAVQDGSSPGKRLIAVSTLGQVVESTGTGEQPLSLACCSWLLQSGVQGLVPFCARLARCQRGLRFLQWSCPTLSTPSCWASCCAC